MAKAAPKQEAKRFLGKDEEVFHDLFILDVENTKRNISFSEKNPVWDAVPHKHYYHTVDSSGRKLNKSAPTAGHFHIVEVSQDKDGNLVGKCGAPMVMHNGKPVKYKIDDHRHDVIYSHSEKVLKRKISPDAANAMALMGKEEAEAKRGVAGIIA